MRNAREFNHRILSRFRFNTEYFSWTDWNHVDKKTPRNDPTKDDRGWFQMEKTYYFPIFYLRIQEDNYLTSNAEFEKLEELLQPDWLPQSKWH